MHIARVRGCAASGGRTADAGAGVTARGGLPVLGYHAGSEEQAWSSPAVALNHVPSAVQLATRGTAPCATMAIPSTAMSASGSASGFRRGPRRAPCIVGQGYWGELT